jgi:voltage-gated potassium channel
MKRPIWDRIRNTSRSVYLLVSLVLLVFVYPVVADSTFAVYVIGILFAVTPLAGVYAIADSRRSKLIAMVLATPALTAIVWHFFVGYNIRNDEYVLLFVVVYYVYTTVEIIRNIFRRHEVDADTIITAISAYLMIGLCFAVSFMLVESVHPGSLAMGTADGLAGWADIFYFSYVTLTTLGYGDIAPVVRQARSLATLEAICGAMYMSILIARLVSDYQHSKR